MLWFYLLNIAINFDFHFYYPKINKDIIITIRRKRITTTTIIIVVIEVLLLYLVLPFFSKPYLVGFSYLNWGMRRENNLWTY